MEKFGPSDKDVKKSRVPSPAKVADNMGSVTRHTIVRVGDRRPQSPQIAEQSEVVVRSLTGGRSHEPRPEPLSVKRITKGNQSRDLVDHTVRPEELGLRRADVPGTLEAVRAAAAKSEEIKAAKKRRNR